MNFLAKYLLILLKGKLFSFPYFYIMEKHFIPAEKELALEAWMLQTFRLDDTLLQEDLVIEAWLAAELYWFELN